MRSHDKACRSCPNIAASSERLPSRKTFPWQPAAVRPGRSTDLVDVPSLADRRRTPGGKLSGGEQQMLAIGRALVTGPKLLLLDEPTEGLAPIIVDQLLDILRELKAAGLSLLLVEQNLAVCTAVADRFAILDGGRIVWEGTEPHCCPLRTCVRAISRSNTPDWLKLIRWYGQEVYRNVRFLGRKATSECSCRI
jgi:ABC-type multidrug transport system ATPase subunit